MVKNSFNWKTVIFVSINFVPLCCLHCITYVTISHAYIFVGKNFVYVSLPTKITRYIYIYIRYIDLAVYTKLASWLRINTCCMVLNHMQANKLSFITNTTWSCTPTSTSLTSHSGWSWQLVANVTGVGGRISKYSTSECPKPIGNGRRVATENSCYTDQRLCLLFFSAKLL